MTPGGWDELLVVTAVPFRLARLQQVSTPNPRVSAWLTGGLLFNLK